MDLEQFTKDREIEEKIIKKFKRRKKALILKNSYFNKIIENKNQYLNIVIGFLSPMDEDIKIEFANFIYRNDKNMTDRLKKIIDEKIAKKDELIKIFTEIN